LARGNFLRARAVVAQQVATGRAWLDDSRDPLKMITEAVATNRTRPPV
jgi:hypothetical protein